MSAEKPSETRLTPGLVVAGLVMGIAAFGIALLVMYQNRQSADTAWEYRGTLIDPPQPLTDFSLVNQTGEAVSLSDFKGKWVLLFFGFASCPDICPTTLGEYKRIREALGVDADKVAFLFISLDSTRDTPQTIETYLRVRGTEFVTGLTGSETQISALIKQFGVQFHRIPQGDSYTIEHTSTSFLIDPENRLRVLFSFDPEVFSLNPAMVAGRIRELL